MRASLKTITITSRASKLITRRYNSNLPRYNRITNLDMHFTLRLQHARREDVGTKEGEERPDDGLVLVSEVHAGAGIAAAAVVHRPLFVYQLHHRDDAVYYVSGFVAIYGLGSRERCHES